MRDQAGLRWQAGLAAVNSTKPTSTVPENVRGVEFTDSADRAPKRTPRNGYAGTAPATTQITTSGGASRSTEGPPTRVAPRLSLLFRRRRHCFDGAGVSR
ncbi:MAG: hypothetical protein ACRDRI_15560 [Pseudonocardiaceae bacterium]